MRCGLHLRENSIKQFQRYEMRIIWGILAHAYWTFWTMQLAYIRRFNTYEGRQMTHTHYPKQG